MIVKQEHTHIPAASSVPGAHFCLGPHQRAGDLLQSPSLFGSGSLKDHLRSQVEVFPTCTIHKTTVDAYLWEGFLCTETCFVKFPQRYQHFSHFFVVGFASFNGVLCNFCDHSSFPFVLIMVLGCFF